MEVAAYRAIGARHPDPAVRNGDHLAERLVGPAERAILVAGGAESAVKALDMNTDAAWASLGNRSVFARGVHIRTRHIDEVLGDSLLGSLPGHVSYVPIDFTTQDLAAVLDAAGIAFRRKRTRRRTAALHSWVNS